MDLYLWEAVGKNGGKRSGQMEAENVGMLQAQLRRQGFREIKTRKKRAKSGWMQRQRITDKEIVIFTRQLATMVGAGLPLVSCFDLVAKSADNPTLRDITLRVKQDIEAGNSLTDALLKEPKMFDELFVNLVRAGEQSGILDTVLNRLALYKEKAAALRAKVKAAMTYPIAVLVIAFVITGILMVFVVPAFADLFASFGAQLPLPTRIVIHLSQWTQQNGWWLLLALAACGSAAQHAYRKNDAFHLAMDHLALHIPVFGTILRKASVARFARTFSTMVAAGTPILDSLENVANTAGNRPIQQAIRNARTSISEGRSLSEPLEASGLFPLMVTQMIHIGESTGNLELMLQKIADFYEEEVDRAVESLTALLEPIILVILGTLIGGLVVAMYLPIFQMGSVIG
ncbi:MAG: type II secretion system F family protein [Magnetococcales bacterium]|nr:type II secretion system F family protein [Magnetococcales bacterium]MBF0115893.1 type II secretion system F family protein [Magnetococcales bacterium]